MVIKETACETDPRDGWLEAYLTPLVWVFFLFFSGKEELGGGWFMSLR